MSTFTVRGSWGSLVCDAETGTVLVYNVPRYDPGASPDDAGYLHIIQLDVRSPNYRWRTE